MQLSRGNWTNCSRCSPSSVRKATAKPFLPMVRLETSALITYLVGLLVLKQGRRPDVLGNNASVLLAHYTKNMVARLGGGD